MRRDTGEKSFVSQDRLLDTILEQLQEMQTALFTRALAHREAHTFEVDEYADFQKQIEDPGGFFWVHWCGSEACEQKFQETSKATIRLIPFDERRQDGRCIGCGAPSAQRVLVAKSY